MPVEPFEARGAPFRIWLRCGRKQGDRDICQGLGVTNVRDEAIVLQQTIAAECCYLGRGDISFENRSQRCFATLQPCTNQQFSQFSNKLFPTETSAAAS